MTWPDWLSLAVICHCGRSGLYAGQCYWHAEGLARHRSKAAKAGAKTAKLTRVKLCGNKLHAMTPENTLVDGRGLRCRACKVAANRRYAEGRAKPTIRTAVLPYRPKRAPILAHRYTTREIDGLAEAREEYAAWLYGRDAWSLVERAVA